MNTPHTFWKRGDVVSITDAAHPEAICILTSDAAINDSGDHGAWMLLDHTCLQWRTTPWVEERLQQILVRGGVCAQPYPADTNPHPVTTQEDK